MEKIDHDIGLEIECCFPRASREPLAAAIAEPPPRLFVSLQMGGDCSVHGRPAVDSTAEIRARFKESKREEAIAWLTDLLKMHNAYTNKSCGLHVHLDCRHREYMLVQDKLSAALTFMKRFVKASRHDNHYCVMGAGTGHYHAINYGAFFAHQTVEVRLHHGSVDGEEIATWIDFLLYVVNSPKAARTPKTLFGAKKVWNWREDRKSVV